MRPSLLQLWLLCAMLCVAHTCLPQSQHSYSKTDRSTVPPQDRIDINHATMDQLMKLPGVTRIWAERIVRFRPYHSKNALLDQGVVPGKVYGRIKDYIIAHRD